MDFPSFLCYRQLQFLDMISYQDIFLHHFRLGLYALEAFFHMKETFFYCCGVLLLNDVVNAIDQIVHALR